MLQSYNWQIHSAFSCEKKKKLKQCGGVLVDFSCVADKYFIIVSITLRVYCVFVFFFLYMSKHV